MVAAVYAVGDETAEILRSEADVHPEGYHFTYETSNGVKAEEQGALQGEAIAVHGEVKYTAPDGTPVHLTYVADENGFQPTGSHLPVDHPVPEHILRSLEYIRTHQPKDVPGQKHF